MPTTNKTSPAPGSRAALAKLPLGRHERSTVYAKGTLAFPPPLGKAVRRLPVVRGNRNWNVKAGTGWRYFANVIFFSSSRSLSSAVVVMGYHPGIEDDGVYLTAVKSDMNPALYPHDSEFFRVQLQATLFDKWVAGFVQLTHIPVAATELLLQFASIVLIILGCWGIARTLFARARAVGRCCPLYCHAHAACCGHRALSGRPASASPQSGHRPHPARRLPNHGGKRWQAVPLLMLALCCTPSWPRLASLFASS